jgi:hypothetical protein
MKKAFCRRNRLDRESGWYGRTLAALAGRTAEGVSHE